MAEEIKTPMSDFDKVGQVKDTAEFILLQDGVNARVEAPIFEQKILDKTNGKYLGKTEKDAPNGVASLDENKKIPNKNLTFGKIKAVDTNVVSGGEVYEKTIDTISNTNATILKNSIYNFIPEFREKRQVITSSNYIRNLKVKATNYSYNYSFGAFYVDSSAFGYGLMIYREVKADQNVTGSNRLIEKIGEENNTLTKKTRESIKKMQTSKGIQKMIFEHTAWGLVFEFDLDIDLLKKEVERQNNNGIADIRSLWDNKFFWEFNFSEECYSNSGVKLEKYNTLFDALQFRQRGVFKVGDTLVTSKNTNIPTNVVKNGKDFKTSFLTDNYRGLNINSNYGSPKTSYSFIKAAMRDGNYMAGFKWFGKQYTYIGDNTNIYRVSQEITNRFIEPKNTYYEEIKMPVRMNGGENDTPKKIGQIIELDNGEILVEVRDGISVDGTQRDQVYKTIGLADAVPKVDSAGIGVLDFSDPSKWKKVITYKEGSSTQSKCGTAISVHKNIVCLAPYGLGKTGLIWLSTDWGDTFNVIFNMGLDEPEFKAKYSDSIGGYPKPEQLNPPMPSDMWSNSTSSNAHVHGVAYDPYFNRIWVATGDAINNHLGRTAIWYTDDLGKTWVRLQTRGVDVMNTPLGLQPMGFTITKDFVFVTSDSAPDGIYRYTRGAKTDLPEFESAYWIDDTYSNNMKLIGAGSAFDNKGGVYFLFITNSPGSNTRGCVIYTNDGFNFEMAYEYSGTAATDLSWGSFMGNDRFGNVCISLYRDSYYSRRLIKLM